MTQSQLHCCGLMTEQVEEAWQVRNKRNPLLGKTKKPGVMCEELEWRYPWGGKKEALCESATWAGVAEEPSSEPNS